MIHVFQDGMRFDDELLIKTKDEANLMMVKENTTEIMICRISTIRERKRIFLKCTGGLMKI